MPTLAIPNMPEDLMDIMERRAAANGRAVEEEALIWLQCADIWSPIPGVPPVLRERTPEEEAELDRKLRRLHASMPTINTDDAEWNRCDYEGRQ